MQERVKIPDDLITTDFERLNIPEDFGKTIRKIMRKIEVPVHERKRHAVVNVVPGFDDAIGEPVGYGFFFNTQSSIYQLGFTLATTQHPAIREVIDNEHITPGERIEILREKQVLRGLKVLDLGSGKIPGFALAVQALGGDAYTVDGDELPSQFKGLLKGHISLDLNSREAAEIIKAATGGEFDIVTENIIGPVPLSERPVERPHMSTIYTLGSKLLKKGGLMYHSRSLDSDGMVFRKK